MNPPEIYVRPIPATINRGLGKYLALRLRNSSPDMATDYREAGFHQQET
jgi:hypothetical protein